MTAVQKSGWAGKVEMHLSKIALEEPYGWKARIGLLALSTDLAIERDFATLGPGDEVGVFTTRIHLETPNSDQTFFALQNEIVAATRLLVPGSRLDVVVFGCTTASTIIGPARIAELVAEVRPDTASTNPATGAVAALHALGARRVAVVTPYTEQMTGNVTSFLNAAGISLASVRSLGFDNDVDIGSVPVETFAEAVRQSDLANADAVFISCTATKALDAIQTLESEIGLPVVVSNQAAFWHALHLTGWRRPIDGFGRLLKSGWK